MEIGLKRRPTTAAKSRIGRQSFGIPLVARMALEIPKPRDWQAFQRNCVLLFQGELDDPHAQEYGRSGQQQSGIDILGVRNGRPGQYVGIQCRLVSKPLSLKDIMTACEAALRIEARLKEIIFATTAPDDTRATDAAIAAEAALKERGHNIRVVVYGWGALQLLIANNDRAYAAFVPSPPLLSDSSLSAESVLQEILKRVPGLPIAVARSIVAAFGEDADAKTAEEIERILRGKAVEYRTLKDAVQRLSVLDPAVAELRNQALSLIDVGDFDGANQCFRKAREVDRTARVRADEIIRHRRASEAETLIAMGRLSALRGAYADAVAQCLEAFRVASEVGPGTAADAVSLAAKYLKDEVDVIGEAGAAETNIARLELDVLPLVEKLGGPVQAAVLYEIADLYALWGYRTGSNSALRQAIRRFHHLCRAYSSDLSHSMRLSICTRLGDTLVEAGLNRRRLVQVRIGLGIVENALVAAAPFVQPSEMANSQVRLGTAYANAGLLTDGVDEFRHAASAYEAALRLLGSDQAVEAAYARWGLGIAYSDWGARQGSLDLLLRAEAECDLALKEFTFETMPVAWATLTTNRGNARLERGRIENNDDTLWAAVHDYRAALRVRTAERFRLGHLKTRGNMAIAMGLIADRRGDVILAEEALSEMTAALGVMAGAPQDYWAEYYEAEKAMLDRLLMRLQQG